MSISKKAEFRVREEALPEVLSIIQSFLKAIAVHERGRTLSYRSFQFSEPENRFLHLMTFKDTAAEALHKRAPHTQAFVDRLYPLCLEPPVFTDLQEILQ